METHAFHQQVNKFKLKYHYGSNRCLLECLSTRWGVGGHIGKWVQFGGAVAWQFMEMYTQNNIKWKLNHKGVYKHRLYV